MSTQPAETSHGIKDNDLGVARWKIILASVVGTTIEFYDFYIYATAAVSVFPLIFFPGDDPQIALLASMATFGAAFVARPLGSIIFGHMGDRVGRKATLIGALLTMGIATFIIGLLPTYLQIGLWAPAMLTILRFCQGLGLGGEWSGAALLVTETAKPGKRASAAMWPQLGAPFGFLLANGFFLLLTLAFNYDSAADGADHVFIDWVWRVPFLASIVMVGIGLWVRLSLEETPVFKQAIAKDQRVKAPLKDVFAKNWWQLTLGTFIMYATYVLFYLMTTWVLSYAIGAPETGGLGTAYNDFLVIQLISILFFAAFVPVSGYLADKFGRKPTMLIITGLLIVFGLLFGWWLNADIIVSDDGTLNTTRMVLFMIVGMALMGLTFGPMSAILPELFPTETRYTGSGIAYNVSSILGAALTPFIATWLMGAFDVSYVGYYLAAAAFITLIFLALSPETKYRSLSNLDADEIQRTRR
ncbi:MAG: MHS family MFS transporter [Micrococcaceae bacterium]|nr:MHS family MFS transporter [Micrococcaceae bacterium]